MVFPTICPPDFVAEWKDRVQDALEAQQAQQTAAASAATATSAAAEGGSNDASGTEAAAGAEALCAAHQAVLTQFAFGFRAIQAPKVCG